MVCLCAPPETVVALPGFTEPFSAISHLIGIGVFGLLTPSFLKRGRGRRGRVASMALMAFAVLFMFSMSSVYHLLPHGSTSRGVMLRMDHAAIFVLIASTVTALHTIMFRGIWRWGPILFFWLVVASMVPLKAVFLTSLSEWVNTGVYLGLGLPGLGALTVLVRRLGWRNCAPFMAGGVSYIVGAVFNQLFWPNLIPGVVHAHELFHLFVIGGVACHWRFVWMIAGMSNAQPPNSPVAAAQVAPAAR